MICSDIGCHKSANPHIPIFIICLRVYIIIISSNFESQHYSVICCHHNVILDTLERSVGRMGIWVAADVAANDARCIQMLAWATTTDVPYSRQWVKINQINGPFSCIDSAELSCIRPLFAQCLMLYSDITIVSVQSLIKTLATTVCVLHQSIVFECACETLSYARCEMYWFHKVVAL